MSMTEKKKHLVPRLRFPEFRNAGPWEVKRLGEVCEINPSCGPLPDRFIYVDLESVVDGRLIQKREITRAAAPSRAQRVIERGDILFQTVRPYQRNNMFFDRNDGDYVASTGYAQLRSSHNARFLYQMLHTDSFVSAVLARCSGSNYPAINPSDLSLILVSLPPEPEQQKIADCLSSLDEVIELQAKKLEALKAHKRGLMQQLFPREGETTPRLRFPEFRNAGPWEVKRVGDLIKVRNERKPASNDTPLFSLTIEDGVTPKTERYNREFLVVDSNKQYKLVLPGDIVYNPANLRWGAIGVSKLSHPVVVSPIYEVLYQDTDEHNHDFICTALMRPKQIFLFSRKGQGTLLERIAVTIEDFLDTDIEIPPQKEEQQKIADCLSSLDEVIELEAKKLEALKAHKKGLLQQLFPQEVTP
jgi:type I restriction enzyme S subunit